MNNVELDNKMKSTNNSIREKRGNKMTKLFKKVMVLCMVFIALLGIEAQAKVPIKTPVKVKVNGVYIDFKDANAVMDSNYRTLVPAREFCEAIGAVVKWEGKEKKVYINREGKDVQLELNQRAIFVDGERKDIDTEILLDKNKTYVPLRAITEAFDESVIWTASTKTAEISVKPIYNHYRGQLHAHTSLSDGMGDPDEAFAFVKSLGNVDFFALTEHSQMFDNDTTANLFEHESQEWAISKEAAERYTEDGRFVAITGFEQSYYDKKSGHMNTFNTEGFLSSNTVDLEEYYQELEKVPDSISQFNHPGTTWGDFWDFGFHSKERDALIHLIEVGNGPGKELNKGYWRCDGLYHRALDKGWHVSPTNNQDNHIKDWMISNPFRTVILAKELTKESIFKAIRENRVYSTEDENVAVEFYLNGYAMGTKTWDDIFSVSICVNVFDPDYYDPIKEISVYTNGGKRVAYETFKNNVSSTNYQITIDAPKKAAYYYVKVTQKDGNLIFTSPIWIEK